MYLFISISFVVHFLTHDCNIHSFCSCRHVPVSFKLFIIVFRFVCFLSFLQTVTMHFCRPWCTCPIPFQKNLDSCQLFQAACHPASNPVLPSKCTGRRGSAWRRRNPPIFPFVLKPSLPIATNQSECIHLKTPLQSG